MKDCCCFKLMAFYLRTESRELERKGKEKQNSGAWCKNQVKGLKKEEYHCFQSSKKSPLAGSNRGPQD